MATALFSAYTSQPVPDDLAMTGELTLSGLVLPVGGIKEKLLAAHRAGMRKIIVPKENEADLIKLPQAVRDELTITTVSTLSEVLDAVFKR
jgi:ATP-dependent Lon protease